MEVDYSNPNWNRILLGVDQAIRLSQEMGEGIKIAVLDTGVDYSHPSVSSRFDPHQRGINLVHGQNPNDPIDLENHGTLVARIIAGQNTGIAPGSSLYAIKLSDNINFPLRNIILGIDWSIANHMDIINMSLGGPMYDSDLHEKCKEAKEQES